VTGDICDEAVQKNLVNQTVEKFGRLDVLVILYDYGYGYFIDIDLRYN